jgi:hypothetical protein
MPKLPAHQTPEAKLDSAAGHIDVALTRDQKRGAFEKPGYVMYAIVALTSTSYTGHADGEDKAPHVKFRITECEVAASDEEAVTLADAKRAMWRRRQMEGTFDEVGPGPTKPDDVLAAGLAGHPTEDEYREHQRAKEDRRRGEYVR